MISVDNFEAHVPYKIWERGEIYYESDAVSDLEEVSDGEWVATIEGTDDYEVEISLEGDEITSWNCDCSYDGEICKHVVATVLAIRSQRQQLPHNTFVVKIKNKQTDTEDALNVEEVPAQNSSKDLKSLISLLNPEELSTFILEYASRSPELATALRQRIQTKTLTGVTKDVRSAVIKAFNTYIRSAKSRYRYNEAERDWETVVIKVDSLLEKARHMAEHNNTDGTLVMKLSGNNEANIYVKEKDNDRLFYLLQSAGIR